MKQRRMFANPADRPLNAGSSLKQSFSMREGFKIGNTTALSPLMRPIQSESRQPQYRLSSGLSNEQKRLKKDEESFQQSYFEDSKAGHQALPQDVISVAVKLPKQAGVSRELVYPINIHKGRDVEDIFNKVAGLLNTEFGVEKSQFRLLYKSCPVDIKKSLKEAEITQDCEMFVLVDAGAFKVENPAPEPEEAQVEEVPKKDLGENEQVPEDMLPKAPAQGYTCTPSMVNMARMTLSQFKAIKEFTLQNEHGSIKFITPPGKPGLDLSQVDLARDFIINKRCISCYDNLPMGVQKPGHNEKLNVPSIVTLFCVEPKGKISAEQQENKLRELIKK